MEQLILDVGAVNKLDHCWICGNRGGLEEHHIIPRAYGGTNGPQVTLCGICHATIDVISNQNELFEVLDTVEIQRTFLKRFSTTLSHPLQGNSNDACAKAYYLASRIYISRKLVKKNPNKPIQVSVSLSGEESRKLKRLTKYFGLSQDSVLHVALNELHTKYVED